MKKKQLIIMWIAIILIVILLIFPPVIKTGKRRKRWEPLLYDRTRLVCRVGIVITISTGAIITIHKKN